MNLYQDILMDHYRHPRNRGELPRSDFSSGQFNPSCGDQVAMQGRIADGKIANLAFTGKGCVISQATASLLTEQCKQKAVADVLAMDRAFVLELIGMELGPTRLKCALLPLEALQKGIQEHHVKSHQTDS